jgi:hypothetical protein
MDDRHRLPALRPTRSPCRETPPESSVGSLATKKSQRCPKAGLTQRQAFVLALLSLGTDYRTSHGIYRSLVIQGMITPEPYTLTPEGYRALCRCTFFARKRVKLQAPKLHREAHAG